MHGSAPDFPSERDRLLALRIVLIVRRRPITFTPSRQSACAPGLSVAGGRRLREERPRRQRQQPVEVDEGAGDGQPHSSISFIKSLSPLELCMSSTEAPRRGNPPDRQGSFAARSGNEDARRITEAPRRGNPPDRQDSLAGWPPEDGLQIVLHRPGGPAVPPRSGNEDARRITEAPRRGNPPDRHGSPAGWPPEDGRSTETRSCGEHCFEKWWLVHRTWYYDIYNIDI